MTAAQRVERWNAAHPIGTAVEYRSHPRDEDAFATTTRSDAWVLGGHTAVVMIEGHPGCVALYALRLLPAAVRAA